MSRLPARFERGCTWSIRKPGRSWRRQRLSAGRASHPYQKKAPETWRGAGPNSSLLQRAGPCSCPPPLRYAHWVEQNKPGASGRPAPRLNHLKQFCRFGRGPATVAIHPTADIRLRRSERRFGPIASEHCMSHLRDRIADVPARYYSILVLLPRPAERHGFAA